MKKIIIALMVLAMVAPVFADSYNEYEEYESFDFLSVSVGGDFGWGKAVEKLDGESLVTKTTNMDVDLRFDGALYFTNVANPFQIGIGFNAGIGFPVNTVINGEKQTEFLMPFFAAVTLETAFRFNPATALEVRAGLGYRYTTLSIIARVDHYVPIIWGSSAYLGTDDLELRQNEVYATAGLGLRYNFDDEVAIRVGAEATYSFFQSLDLVLRRSSPYYGSYDANTETISVADFSRIAVKPYISIAVTM